MTGGIILANFEKDFQVRETSYQSEAELERQMIENLISQGYERLIVKSNDDLYLNLKNQIEKLNKISFSDEEWSRFLIEYLVPRSSSISSAARGKNTSSSDPALRVAKRPPAVVG